IVCFHGSMGDAIARVGPTGADHATRLRELRRVDSGWSDGCPVLLSVLSPRRPRPRARLVASVTSGALADTRRADRRPPARACRRSVLIRRLRCAYIGA